LNWQWRLRRLRDRLAGIERRVRALTGFTMPCSNFAIFFAIINHVHPAPSRAACRYSAIGALITCSRAQILGVRPRAAAEGGSFRTSPAATLVLLFSGRGDR
jgi:hypothetical protein